jgi:hypothetical protein
MDLIRQKQYFVIHAARQSGKTTLLLELAQQLNDSEEYYALYCSLETVQEITAAKEGIPAIIQIMKSRVKFHHTLRNFPFANQVDYANFTVALLETLTYFSEELDKPLVILFDEVDCLANGTLVSFLRQLRDGYVNRGNVPFVHSIVLVGMRNIRDYKSRIRDDRETLGSASPFNIVKVSKTLRNFTPDDIANLYAQHTQATGQRFSATAVGQVYEQTQGQPWLVNAIACEIVEQILNREVSRDILPEQVEQAVQTLVWRRDTHFDSLMERLTEARVQRIVEPLLIGERKGYSAFDDDYQYVLDLGLLRSQENRLEPANPIYAEVMLRTLSSQAQLEMEHSAELSETRAYVVNGQLEMKPLLSEFQQFWRENSDIWVERYQYKEAAPHLILQAFLQRVVNCGGRLSRELASGAGRLDLCVHYQQQRYPIELKLRYSEKTYSQGQQQLHDYLDKLGCAEGWLIVFDRRPTVPWEEKIFWHTKSVGQKTIHLVGC